MDLGFEAAGALAAALDSGLAATFVWGLVALLSVSAAVLAGEGLVPALVLRVLGVSALDWAGALAVALPLGSGLVGALTGLLAGLFLDLVGALGIGLEGFWTGVWERGFGADLDSAFALGLLAGVFAILLPVLPCLGVLGAALEVASDLDWVAPLAVVLGADLPLVEAAFGGGLALRTD